MAPQKKHAGSKASIKPKADGQSTQWEPSDQAIVPVEEDVNWTPRLKSNTRISRTQDTATITNIVARNLGITVTDSEQSYELTTSKLATPENSHTGDVQTSRSALPQILREFLDLGYDDFGAICSFLSFKQGIREVDTNALLQLIARCIAQTERNDLSRLAQRYVLLTPSLRTNSESEQRIWISTLPSNESSREELKKACDFLLHQLDESAKRPHQKQSLVSRSNYRTSPRSKRGSQGRRSVDGSQTSREHHLRGAASLQLDLDSPLGQPEGQFLPQMIMGPSSIYVPSEVKVPLMADYQIPIGETQINQVFRVGNMFGTFWHDNYGRNPPNNVREFQQDPTKMEPRAYVTMVNNGEWVFSHIKRFIVVSARQGFCTALPVTSYSKRGLSAKNITSVEYRAHGIAYDQWGTPKLIEGESPFTKDPIRFEMVEGENLTKSSRICYAKPQTIEYNRKVKHMGVMCQNQISTFLVAFGNELLPTLPTR